MASKVPRQQFNSSFSLLSTFPICATLEFQSSDD